VIVHRELIGKPSTLGAVGVIRFLRLVRNFNVGKLKSVDMQKLEGIISDAMYKCVDLGLWSGPNFDYESVAEWAVNEIARALKEAGLSKTAVSKIVESIKDKIYQEAYNCAVDGYYSGNGAVDCSHAVKDLMDKLKGAISEATKTRSANSRLKV